MSKREFKSTAEREAVFVAEAVNDFAARTREFEMCPRCAIDIFARTMVQMIQIGVIKHMEDYDAKELAMCPFVTDTGIRFSAEPVNKAQVHDEHETAQ